MKIRAYIRVAKTSGKKGYKVDEKNIPNRMWFN